MTTIKDKIEEMVREASQEAQDRGLLPQVTLPDVLVERPQNPEHGDYAATAPLKLARAARMKPLVIAQHLVDLLQPTEEIDTITMAPPGFINFS
ncbi:MAG: arginine--tRNA ligase, partial [Dehalococcoidia bacterium]